MLNPGPPKKNATHDMHSFRVEPEPERPMVGNWLLLALAVIVIVALVIFSVPAYKGYRVYKAMEAAQVPEQYAADMAGLAGAKAQAESQLADTGAQLDSCKVDFGLCTQERTAKAELVESLGSDLSKRGAELDACDAQTETDSIVIANAARRICCIQRVENPAISGFAVIDGKISCVTEGGESIAC